MQLIAPLGYTSHVCVALGRTEFHHTAVAFTVKPPSGAGVMYTLRVPVSGPVSATFVFQPNRYSRWRTGAADGDGAGVESVEPNNRAKSRAINLQSDSFVIDWNTDCRTYHHK